MNEFWMFFYWGVGTLLVAGLSVILARRFGIEFIVAAMAGVLIISNILAVKLVSIFGYTVPAGVFTFAAIYLLTDMLSERWGRQAAQKAVWTSFYANLVILFPVIIAVNWQPAFPSDVFESFDSVLVLAPRIVLASFVAYLISQHHDVLAFDMWKKITKGRFLWLRNNASTFVSQFIDSVIFITIAFAGTSGSPPLIEMILAQYFIKLMIAIFDPPLIYMLTYCIDRIPFRKVGP